MNLTPKLFVKSLVNSVKAVGTQKMITTDKLSKDIETTIEELEIIVNMFDTFTATDRYETIVKYNELLKSKDADMYSRYTKFLDDELRRDEEKIRFSTIEKACNNVLKTLKSIKPRQVYEILEDDDITIDKINISSTLLIKFISSGKLLAKYTDMLMNVIMRTVTDNGEYKHKNYVYEYLDTNMDKFTTTVNNINSSKGKYSFVDEIKDMNKKSIGGYTVDELDSLGGDNFAKDVVKYRTTKFLNVFDLIDSLNPITLISNLYISYISLRISRYKQIKINSETRLAYLRMVLSNTNDPKEKAKLKSICDKYDKIIADYDRKIEDIEKGS